MLDKLAVVCGEPYIVENTLINSQREGAGYNRDRRISAAL